MAACPEPKQLVPGLSTTHAVVAVAVQQRRLILILFTRFRRCLKGRLQKLGNEAPWGHGVHAPGNADREGLGEVTAVC